MTSEYKRLLTVRNEKNINSIKFYIRNAVCYNVDEAS